MAAEVIKVIAEAAVAPATEGIREVVSGLSFQQQVIATLIGTFAGFFGSLILFWIKESRQKKNKEDSLITNLLYEFDYNINLLCKYETELTQCIESVGADSKSVYCSIEYDKVARFFSIQFYREGLISKYLHPENMKRWNDFLSSLGEGSEEYIKNRLEQWRGSNIDKETVFKALKHERNVIKYAREMSEYLKNEISPEKKSK